MRVACGDVYVGSWRRLIEVLIEAGRDPTRAAHAGPPAPGGAPRGARSSSGRARKQEKNFILPYAHHEASKPSPYALRRESPPLIAPPIRGQAVR